MALFRTPSKRGGRSVGTFDSKIPGIGPGLNIAQVPANLNDSLVSPNVGIVSRAQKEKVERERIAEVEQLPELHIISSVISVYSEEEIERISVVDIVNPDISSPRFPMAKSLYDTSMGTIVSDRMCGTCQIVNCLGHFGRIPFASPIPHPMWLNVIKDILTSVCNSCGGLLVSEEIINHNGWLYLSPQKRIAAIAKLAATRKSECPNTKKCPDIKSGKVTECQPNPVFKPPKPDESFYIKEEVKIGTTTKSFPVLIEKILSIFKCISHKDAKLMGFKGNSRPENLILQSLLVIPPVSRPPFIADNKNNPDDLTECYRQIVICANELRLNPGSDRIRLNLYFKVKVLMEGKKQKYKNVKRFMSITNRLQGKQAVPRASLMGKRTNMCARTVITPDTSLAFGQIRIPIEWASLLTIPVAVSALNIRSMRSLLKQGKITDIETRKFAHKAHGAEASSMKTSYRQAATEDSVIHTGDTVWRHLRDGDTVVINRQPTLHKFSMMAFEVKLGKERSVGLHLTYTTPFNADFDGDELNIWVPQSIEAIAEAKELLHVTKNIMSPAKNKVNMGLVYDAITASFLLSKEKLIDEGLYYELKEIVQNSEDLASLDQRLLKHKVPPRSGRGVFSMVLPYDLNYFKKGLIILDGVLISGNITGEHVGPASGSLPEAIFMMENGRKRYAEFITNASYMVLKYISERGHTVGISDCMAIDADKRKKEMIENEKAVEIIQAKIDALGPVPSDETSRQLHENKIKDILMSSGEMGFSLIKENISSPENNIGAMLQKIGGGAKGKVFNIQQIRGRLGQQYRKGERLPLSCGGRILPGFDRNDPDIRARGYIKSNFMRGLSPEEHFLHMMAAREGLIDTAVNVAIMGDIHRRIVKALENMFVGESGAVVNSSKAIFQLLFGADGFDPARLVTVKKVGSDGDPVASFIDVREKAEDLNLRAGWISKKTAKMSSYNIYIIEMNYVITKKDIFEISKELTSSDISESLYNHFGFDQLLQEVTISPLDKEKDPIGLAGIARFYYRISESDEDEKLEDRRERFDLESTYQLSVFQNLIGKIILINSGDVKLELIIRSASLL